MRPVAVVLVALFVVLTCPAASAAQAPALTLAELARRPGLNPGKLVIITFAPTANTAPQQVRAKLVSVDATAIRIKMGEKFAGARTDLEVELVGSDGSELFASLPYTVVEIPAARVVRVATIDSLANGALIGAAIGAAPAALLVGAYCSGGEPCNGAGAAAGVAIGAGIGAGIGILADFARKREGKVLFEAPTGTTPVSYALTPIVSRERKGALFVISW